jgi:SulP family sulfate permease
LLLELQTAIYAGVLASLFFYLKRTSQPRVQQWREGKRTCCASVARFFRRQPLPASAPARLQGKRVVIEAQQINFIDYSGWKCCTRRRGA